MGAIAQGEPWHRIPNLVYEDSSGVLQENERALPIQNLDDLPFPALHLLDNSLYRSNPRAVARRSPLGGIETSRGCPYSCSYCGKIIFGKKTRGKSPARVSEEFQHYEKHGYREIAILDDLFTYDLDRAKAICELLIRRKSKLLWQLDNGIRVNGVDKEFFRLAKRAGCYKVSFGFESGDDMILKSIGKMTTTQEGREAVIGAKKAGMETVGFFMLGLPQDTRKTLQRTIRFAQSLPLDYAKVTFMTPLPGTRVFDMYKAQGRILSEDWGKYHFHQLHESYSHPNLTWPELTDAYDEFYRKFYLRFSYIAPRIIRSLLRGEIFSDIAMAREVFLS